MAIRGVIFDVDGTLVDSNDAHAWAWFDAFREAGLSIPFEQIRPLIGKGGDKLIPEVSPFKAESQKGKRIARRRSEIFLENYLPQVTPFRASRELLLALKSSGLELAIATSAKDEELRPLLKVANVQDLFEEKISSDDAERSKPDPDIVVAAIDKLRLRKSELVMIGDTPYDIEAALGAGIPCIAFRSGGWDKKHLMRAIEIYDGPEDLLGHLDTSLLASENTLGPPERHAHI